MRVAARGARGTPCAIAQEYAEAWLDARRFMPPGVRAGAVGCRRCVDRARGRTHGAGGAVHRRGRRAGAAQPARSAAPVRKGGGARTATRRHAGCVDGAHRRRRRPAGAEGAACARKGAAGGPCDRDAFRVRACPSAEHAAGRGAVLRA
eukprot:346545-Pleurochrysis_carterae.AAC.1